MNVNLKLVALSAITIVPTIQKVQAAKKQQQPNIVYILVDDHGIGDMGCFGSKVVKTPNLDAFYSDAIRFTDFHVSPTSAPSRSAIMTGRYSNRVGCWHTINGRSIVWEDEITMADVLKANGYATGIFGKWHMGDNYPSRPDDKGFEEVLVHGGGGMTQAPDYWGNDYFDDFLRHNGEWKQYEGYCTDVFFENAMNFIDKSVKDKKPFFCYIPTNAAHSPLNVPEKYINMYPTAGRMSRFYGMITNVDDNFAILRKKLQDLGIEDNTIVMYMTDNGTAGGDSGGYRGRKGSEYDGGHRVPWLLRYPKGGLTGGKDITTLTSHIDMLPTFIEYLDLKKGLPIKPMDGESLVPLLEGKDVSWKDRSVIVDSQRNSIIVKWKKSSVMNGKWRLVNGKELYDMSKDKAQKNDIAAAHPDMVKKLTADYDAWWEDIAVKEDVNNRFGYIVAGGAENPIRGSSHDMQGHTTAFYSQKGALLSNPGRGIVKIGIEKDGKYKFSLCRFPLETGLKFNSKVAKVEPSAEIQVGMPASKDVEYKNASLIIGDFKEVSPVDMNAQSVDFVIDMKEGKYDMNACFVASDGKKYPPYYFYIEKID